MQIFINFYAQKSIIFILFLFIVFCFACLYVCVMVPDPLELEWQAVVSHHVCVGNWT